MLSKEEQAENYSKSSSMMPQGRQNIWEIDAFLAGYTARDEEDGWVPVSERLPSENGDYIIYGRFTKDCPNQSMEAYYSKRDRCFRKIGIKSKNVTHWQPLPSKPVEK